MKKRIIIVKNGVEKETMSETACCVGAVIRFIPGSW